MASFTKTALLATIFLVTVSAERDCTKIINRIKNLSENSVKRFTGKSLEELGDYIKRSDRTDSSISEIYPYDGVIRDLVNYQIQQEMSAFYEYTNMAMFFHRHDKDFPGFAKYFQAGADEELKHAHMFMKFQAKRGGSLKLMDLKAPKTANWKNAVEVIEEAFKLEKKVTEKILCLHDIGSQVNDKDFVDFLESNMIGEQYESMRELSGHKQTLDRMAGKDLANIGLAEFQFDLMLQKKQD